MLGGSAQTATEGRRASELVQKRVQQNREKLEAYEQFCHDIGESPADIALAWTLSNPAVTAPIIGPRTLDQLTESLHALDINLDEVTLKKLDEIFPGPGGAAPEAYAW